jgi:hypothetical protein
VCEYFYHIILLFVYLCVYDVCCMYSKLLFNRMSVYNHHNFCSFAYISTIAEKLLEEITSAVGFLHCFVLII